MNKVHSKNTTKTVFVGLSGGVDSSVAALRLLRAGYNVVGVFIKVWHPEWLACNWEQERLDAMRVAAKLNIPFLTCNAEQTYKDDVADYFIKEYTAGRTPNPDVMCNKYVKFGAFLDFATQHGADYIATGHYVQRRQRANAHGEQTYELQRGADTNKDQSYFLWTLTEAQLAATLFPVGDTNKTSIRAEAVGAGLPTAKKADSQGICFLGQIDIPSFLAHYVELVPGVVQNEAGKTIGTHQGALVYTIGQRHGFTITTSDTTRTPYYVTARNLATNTITVSHEKATLPAAARVILTDYNLNTAQTALLETCTVQFRYRQTPIVAHVTNLTPARLTLELETSVEAPDLGQSCVLYSGDRCLGGGIIASCRSQS